ncbi:hypothetical protein CR513_19384, partial [Mucuna pruriens]
MAEDPDYTMDIVEPLSLFHYLDTETTLWIDNATLAPDNASKSSRQDEGGDPEEEVLIELERTIEQERLRFRFGTEDLEVVNPNGEEGAREILNKPTSFAWSYQDMPSLDITVIEHRLPLIPNAFPVWTKRMINLGITISRNTHKRHLPDRGN